MSFSIDQLLHEEQPLDCTSQKSEGRVRLRDFQSSSEQKQHLKASLSTVRQASLGSGDEEEGRASTEQVCCTNNKYIKRANPQTKTNTPHDATTSASLLLQLHQQSLFMRASILAQAANSDTGQPQPSLAELQMLLGIGGMYASAWGRYVSAHAIRCTPTHTQPCNCNDSLYCTCKGRINKIKSVTPLSPQVVC